MCTCHSWLLMQAAALMICIELKTLMQLLSQPMPSRDVQVMNGR